ncbi:hypothetical protein RCL1_005557 [Eukaryota sp. TZLM3-RCL]
MSSFKLYKWNGCTAWTYHEQSLPDKPEETVYDHLKVHPYLTHPPAIIHMYCSQNLQEKEGILEVSEGGNWRQILSLQDFFREPFKPIELSATFNSLFDHQGVKSGAIVSLSIHPLLRREWFVMKKIALPSSNAAVEECLTAATRENLFMDFRSCNTSDATLHPVALSCYPLLNFVHNINTWSPSLQSLDENNNELSDLLNDVLSSIQLSQSSTVEFKVLLAHKFESIVDVKVVAHFNINEFNCSGEFEVPVVYWEQKLGTGAGAADFQFCIYGYNDVLDRIHSETRNFEGFLMTRKPEMTSHLPALHIQITGPQLSLSISSLQSLFVFDPVTSVDIRNSSSPSVELSRAMTFFYCFFTFLEDIAQHYFSKCKSYSTILDNLYPLIPAEIQSEVGTVTFRRALGRQVFDADLHRNNSHRHVIIKYSDTYCEELHQMLAAAGFAPEHISTVNMGPFFCTLMDFIDGKRLSEMTNPHNYSFIAEQLLLLKRILFESGYVHGDVRWPNIIVNLETKKIFLLDFDWGMKVDSSDALYPANLNQCINWPEGVNRWSKMTQQHDQLNIDSLISDVLHGTTLDVESPSRQGVQRMGKTDQTHLPEPVEDIGPRLARCKDKVSKRTSGSTRFMCSSSSSSKKKNL